MFDPLMTLLVAKAKAVGLVAGTALATTALVGGGAVAITAVSAESDLQPETTVTQPVDGDASAGTAETVSATPTVGIEEPEAPETPGVPEPLPADFTCDESKNHGQNVSAYARSLPKGPGRGEKISAVAQSDCGKTAETEVEAAGVEEAEEPKPAKADKPAKPAKAEKAEKAEKPAKAQKPASADKPAKAQKSAKADRPAKATSEGKGNGKG